MAFESCKSVMVQLPTGTGKTHLLASVVRDVVQQDESNVVWIIAHRKELVAQIEQTIETFGLPVDHKHPDNCQVRVYSIQWLSRHVDEMDYEPSLIVIDEAHHALAKTYSAVMNTYPQAMKLGMTATPCRMNGKGFTDLFDTLLYGKQINEFIKDGYLSPYDYISIPTSSDEICKIDGLTKRAADGDYSTTEMNEVLDTRPSIARLYETIKEFAPDKKGITYAISIDHANHIAEYYQSKGLKAESISSKTPDAERSRLVNDFNEGRLQILVNVDIFSEGFDCPDVEFIQMARPTLSLAKYLQQVGRGLRVFEGKRYCVLLDNVGLYRLFGLPSTNRNWLDMFNGRERGRGELAAERVAFMQLYEQFTVRSDTDDALTQMVVLTKHDELQERMELQEALRWAGTDTSNLKRLNKGWLSDGAYIRKEASLKLYKKVGQRNFGRELMIDIQGIYYSFEERSEELIMIGRNQPWTQSVEQLIKKNPLAYSNVYQGLTKSHTEYIWSAELLGTDNIRFHNGLYCLTKGKSACSDMVYHNISKAKSGVRSFIDDRKKHGIMNQDGNYYLLWDKWSVDLKDNGLVYVKDDCDDLRGIWINLYTMQEFHEAPRLVRFGFVDMLQVGNQYFVQKVRLLAGIALSEHDFAYNDGVFQVLDYYVILKKSPHTVLRIGNYFGDRVDRQFKLLDMQSYGSNNYNGSISQSKLPRTSRLW